MADAAWQCPSAHVFLPIRVASDLSTSSGSCSCPRTPTRSMERVLRMSASGSAVRISRSADVPGVMAPKVSVLPSAGSGKLLG